MQVWLDGDDNPGYRSMTEEEIVDSVLESPSDF
jgi:hypothetical protein